MFDCKIVILTDTKDHWKIYVCVCFYQLRCLSASDIDIELVGAFNHFLFSMIYGIILPIDSYFSEGLKTPTREDGIEQNYIIGLVAWNIYRKPPIFNGKKKNMVSCMHFR